MSFRCQQCNEVQGSRKGSRRVVTRWRTVENWQGKEIQQIAEEQNWCDGCFAASGETPEPETAIGIALKEAQEESCAS